MNVQAWVKGKLVASSELFWLQVLEAQLNNRNLSPHLAENSEEILF